MCLQELEKIQQSAPVELTQMFERLSSTDKLIDLRDESDPFFVLVDKLAMTYAGRKERIAFLTEVINTYQVFPKQELKICQ